MSRGGGGVRMAEDHVVEKVLRDTIGAVHTEDLLVEALRDLVKDEVKAYVGVRLGADPAARAGGGGVGGPGGGPRAAGGGGRAAARPHASAPPRPGRGAALPPPAFTSFTN